MKNIRFFFYLKIFLFLVVKFSIYLNRCVFVMVNVSLKRLTLNMPYIVFLLKKNVSSLSHFKQTLRKHAYSNT